MTNTIRFACIAMSIAFCASAFAGTEAQTKKTRVVQKSSRVMCLVFAGSGIPEACDRFAGPIPTTAYPLEVLGRAY
jgi:hypothetical protein